MVNRTVSRARQAWQQGGDIQPVLVTDGGGLDDAVHRGVPAMAEDPAALFDAESIDVVVEATGTVEFGADVVQRSIASGKHVVLVNAELDSTLGPLLHARAEQAGVVYTNTDGDEPGVAMTLLRYLRSLGLKPVAAGNLKGMIDHYRTPETQRLLFTATAVALVLIYIGCRALSRTKFGLVQQAIRDGENRVLFSGYAAAHYKLFIFVFAAIIASIGGALYVPQVGGINPSVMTPDKSLEAVVWVAVGGRATLIGPIVGAISVNWLKSWATKAIPDYWLILLGILFVLVVLFLPGGIVSIPGKIAAFCKARFGKKA